MLEAENNLDQKLKSTVYVQGSMQICHKYLRNEGYKTIRPQKCDRNLKEETTWIIPALNHSLCYSQRKYYDEQAEKVIKILV